MKDRKFVNREIKEIVGEVEKDTEDVDIHLKFAGTYWIT